jgi:hypothetical protein
MPLQKRVGDATTEMKDTMKNIASQWLKKAVIQKSLPIYTMRVVIIWN